MSDLPETKDTKIINYADDITLLATDTSIKQAEKKAQFHLHQVIEWAEANKLKLNLEKTQVTRFTPDPAKIDVRQTSE